MKVNDIALSIYPSEVKLLVKQSDGSMRVLEGQIRGTYYCNSESFAGVFERTPIGKALRDRKIEGIISSLKELI